MEFNEQIAKAEKNEAGTNPVVFDMDYLLETLDCLDSGFEPDDPEHSLIRTTEFGEKLWAVLSHYETEITSWPIRPVSVLDCLSGLVNSSGREAPIDLKTYDGVTTLYKEIDHPDKQG